MLTIFHYFVAHFFSIENDKIKLVFQSIEKTTRSKLSKKAFSSKDGMEKTQHATFTSQWD